jgi:hypothetical protein
MDNGQFGWLRGSRELLKRKDFLVARACNHPSCLALPFTLEIAPHPRPARMLQNVKLVGNDAALGAPTVPDFVETASTYPGKRLESHFAETHSAASRKTHPATPLVVAVRRSASLE